jgi:hypothetical protein
MDWNRHLQHRVDDEAEGERDTDSREIAFALIDKQARPLQQQE